MLRALQEALNSDDPSTQNGAVLVSPKLEEIIAYGYNVFPDGIARSEKRWERPQKYSYIEHAERNSIYYAARNGVKTEGVIMYCPWFACDNCARGIINAGIVEVVGLNTQVDDTHTRWDESVRIGLEMLEEKGVKMRYLDHKFGITLRRNGQLIEF